MFASFLLAAAHAGTLQLPPSEDVEAWRVAAAASGVTLVSEAPDLLLIHDGDQWALLRPEDPSANFPLPPPETPEGRLATLWLAAHLLAQGGPLPNTVNLQPPAPEYGVPDNVVAAAAAAEARTTPDERHDQDDLARAERYPTAGLPPPEPRAARPFPMGWVAGVGVEAGAFANDEPRLALTLSGGARLSRDLSLQLVVEAGLPVTTTALGPRIERDAVRAALGAHGLVVSAGLGRAEIVADGRLHGELIFPVVALEFEVPIAAGPVWVLPRAGVHFTMADVTVNSGEESAALSPVALGFAVTVERVVRSFP